MKDVLFPFDRLKSELAVNLQAPRLEGQTAPSTILNIEERLVNLFEVLGSSRRVEIPVTVTANRIELEEFEKKHGATTLVLVAHCLPTNIRQAVKLQRHDNEPGAWHGVLELDRDNFRDRTEIEPVLTATINGVGHRPVAYGEAWGVHFDAPASLRLRGTLEVKWDHFKTTEELVASQFPDSTHVVTFNGDMPKILLNSDFEGLEPLLKDRKDRRGIEKALYDQLRLQIGRSVWMALLGDAMAAIESPEDGEDPEWPETPWQAEVLRSILHKVDEKKSEIELLQQASSDWKTRGGSGEFLARAEAVIGDLVKSNTILRQFVLHTREVELS